MVRGPGKYKQKRGGGRSFSRNLELDENGIAVSKDRRRGEEEEDEDEDDSDEEESEESEEESDDDEPVGGKEQTARSGTSSAPKESDESAISREERRAMKKALKKPAQVVKTSDDEDEEEDGEDAGDKKDAVPTNQLKKKLTFAPDTEEPRQLSRKEREAKAKAEAQRRYQKLHAEGKTDEAKSDLARLAKIRKEREEAAAKRTALKKDTEAAKQAKLAKSGRKA